MIDWIRKQLRDMLTEPDNKTVCIVRVSALLGFLFGLGLAGWNVIVLHTPFDFQSYSTGTGIAIAGLGAALGLKKDSPTP